MTKRIDEFRHCSVFSLKDDEPLNESEHRALTLNLRDNACALHKRINSLESILLPTLTPWLNNEMGPKAETDPDLKDLVFVRARLREEILRTGIPEIEYLREYMLHDNEGNQSFFGALINAPERLGCIDYIVDHLEDEFIHEAIELEEKEKRND